MQKEIRSMIRKSYEDMKAESGTYGELRRKIETDFNNQKYNTTDELAIVIYKERMKLLRIDTDGLLIVNRP